MPIQFGYYLEIDEDRQIDWQGYSKVLWSRGFRDHHEQNVNFYIDKILREYEPGLATRIPKIMEKIRIEQAKLPRDEFVEKDHTDEVTRISNFRLIEQFEPKFYQIMKEEMEKIKSK